MAVAATGTPVVLVLVAGRPIGSPAVHDAAAAVLMAWLPGERGGGGDRRRAGRRTSAPAASSRSAIPRSSGQIPVFYGHKVSGGRSHWKGEYVDMSNQPALPVRPRALVLDVRHRPDRDLRSDRRPGRHGRRLGDGPQRRRVRADEVVQLYSRDPVASVTRPVLELQAFARVTLDPGESATVDFEIAVADLGFHDRIGRVRRRARRGPLLRRHVGRRPDAAGTVTIKGDAGGRRPAHVRQHRLRPAGPIGAAPRQL